MPKYSLCGLYELFCGHFIYIELILIVNGIPNLSLGLYSKRFVCGHFIYIELILIVNGDA
jgi:hypothetical protein